MALEFIDSFSHSGNGGSALPVTTKWTTGNGTYETTPNRRSGQVVFGFPPDTGGLSKSLVYNIGRTVGFAYYFPESSAYNPELCSFGSGNQGLFTLRIETDYSLSLQAWKGGTWNTQYNSGSVGYYINADTYHYYEISVTLTGGTPISMSASLSIDGGVIFSGVTLNSDINASQLIINEAQMNTVTLGSAIGGDNFSFICDVYILNPNTTDVNGHTTTLTGMLGDVAIDALLPIADVTTGWTQGVSATYDYELVDLIPPTGDSSYLYSDTVTDEETFNFQSLDASIAVLYGAQLVLYVRKDAEGDRAISGLVGSTQVSSIYGVDNYVNEYYNYYTFPLDSNNGTAWTPVNFDAQDFGIELTD